MSPDTPDNRAVAASSARSPGQRILRVLESLFLYSGLLCFALLIFQIWGTGIEYSQSQDELETEFVNEIADTDISNVVASIENRPGKPTGTPQSALDAGPPDPAGVPKAGPRTDAVDQELPDFAAGDVIARLDMPTIRDTPLFVQSGVSVNELRRGPGHYPATVLPGQLGNAAIAGHRTTYGAPFKEIDDFEVGDPLIVTTAAGTFVYRVTGSEVVPPSETRVLDTIDPNRATLTITTCDPEYSTRNRLIVYADFDPNPSAPVGKPTAVAASVAIDPPADSRPQPVADPDGQAPTDSTPEPEEVDSTPEPEGELDDAAYDETWFDEPEAIPHIVGWSAALIGVWYGIRKLIAALRRRTAHLGRYRHVWLFILVPSAAVLVPVLYFWCQNVNRILPVDVLRGG